MPHNLKKQGVLKGLKSFRKRNGSERKPIPGPEEIPDHEWDTISVRREKKPGPRVIRYHDHFVDARLPSRAAFPGSGTPLMHSDIPRDQKP